jgi:hypothetical protein
VAFRSLVSGEVLDLSNLVSVERFARDYERLFARTGDSRFDHAIALKGFPPTIDYLISIGALKAPRFGNSEDLLTGQAPRAPDKIGRILTSMGALPWDMPHCRKHHGGGSLVILDGACVVAALRTTPCTGRIEFAEASPFAVLGFGVPEPHGRWSDGPKASFTCKIPAGTKPQTVRMSTTGFVQRERSQRMMVSINGGAQTEHIYTTSQAARELSLQLPLGKYDAIEIQFFFPDAVSPKELGLSPDGRKLAVSVKSLEFR